LIKITAEGFPDSWDEIALVSLVKTDGTISTDEVELGCLIEDITAFDWMEKDIKTKVMVCGGRTVSKIPFEDAEGLTMKVIPVSADLDGTGVSQMFHPQTADDTTDPIVVLNTLRRNTYDIAILQSSELPSATLGALDIPAADKSAQRILIKNAYMTAYKPSYDDKQWSAEITFKWAPFTKAGASNKQEDSTDGSAQLSAATAFLTDLS